MIRLRAIAGRLQREIGLDAAGDVEGAMGEQRPAIMCRLLAPDKGRDLGFKSRIGRLPKKMLEKKYSAGIDTSASSSKTKCPSSRCAVNSACVAREIATSIWARSGSAWTASPKSAVAAPSVTPSLSSNRPPLYGDGLDCPLGVAVKLLSFALSFLSMPFRISEPTALPAVSFTFPAA